MGSLDDAKSEPRLRHHKSMDGRDVETNKSIESDDS